MRNSQELVCYGFLKNIVFVCYNFIKKNENLTTASNEKLLRVVFKIKTKIRGDRKSYL